MSEPLHTLKRGTLNRLASELDADGRISAGRVAEILNESKAGPARALADEDPTDGLYLEWAAMSGIPLAAVPVEELEQVQADVRAGEEAEQRIAVEEEADRQRRLAAERTSDAEADELYETAWKPWL